MAQLLVDWKADVFLAASNGMKPIDAAKDDADEETELNARRAERQQTNDTARLKAQLADAMRRLEPSAAKDARESGKIPKRPGKRKRPGFS